MKPGFEFEGKNIDNAVKNACDQLNISKAKIKYDVLSNGSSGIFGLVGFKKARIRVIGPEAAIKAYVEKKEADTPPPITSYRGVQSLVDEAFNDKPELKKTAKPKKDTADRQAPVTIPSDKTELNEEPPPVSISPEPITAIEETELTESLPESPIELNENHHKGKEALETIIKTISTEAEVSIDATTDRILYNVKGGDSAVLIGKRGQTLEAIQYIIDKIVNKNTEKRYRIQIDVEGYLENRQATLERLALRLAEKTKRTGKPSTINQMNAHDRRIVHIALKEDKEVRTQSVGNGYYRKLIIFSKKQTRPKKKRPPKKL